MIPFQAVIRPSIPFVETITNGLKVGTTISINGSIPNSAREFAINLATGPNINQDCRSPIAFHFNPRLSQKYVARNSFENQTWGKEESSSPNGEFPFARGAQFEMLITVNLHEYNVTINKKHFISFFHRKPFQQVNTLQILHDVTVEKIFLYSNPSPSSPAPVPTNRLTFYDLTLPFVGAIRSGLFPGNWITVIGFVPNSSNGFQINFASGATLEGPSRSPVAFHFNPRFNQNIVARNSFNRDWAKEENNGGLTMNRGEGFEIKFIITPNEYEVVVNGQYFCVFAHRTPLENVNTLQIMGDVHIAKLVLPVDQQSFGKEQFAGPEPVFNPAIPFVNVIPEFRVEYMVVITGFVPHSAKDFQINFACGATLDGPSRSPIAFHLSPRFNEDILVRNTFNREWGKEERHSKLNFGRGKGFEIVILVKLYEYKVCINGPQVCTFAHRVPIEQVNTLQIMGDVKIARIVCRGPQPVYCPSLPFEYPIPHFAALTIIGTPKSNPERFNIDLLSANHGSRDIFFHFNPRFKPICCVVRNSCFGGIWGEEQRVTPFFDFVPSVRFILRIISDDNNFVVHVNGQLFCYFKHRMSKHLITHLKIAGDVEIDSITFN